ncbi:MAG: RiPP maturation radical SAM C-methyltransferase, partial [Desulfobacteraceae bacterium]|nr:RiPP maturation radical SAM C-methyltransferase [Desulfobacteraceae bacterium]
MNSKVPVLLVQMPFAYLMTPALGLSLFKAILERERIPSMILYFNFLFARRLGAGRYLTDVEPHISEGSNLFGEWIFSGSVFDQSPEAVEEYLARVSEAPRDPFESCGGLERPGMVALLRELRGRVDAFLDHCVEEISRCRPRIVAFTSMFQQHLSCLALARRLKERIPEIFILLGGVNCEKVKGMETARVFPWVDAVVSGEGDLVLPQIVKAVLEGREVPDLPGVAVQGRIPPPGSAEERIDAPAVRNLDELPVPDFSEYFAEVERIRKEAPLDPILLLESSRGCWWRRKKGCHFCSLNLHGSAYRVKSGRKAIEEIVHVAGRYPVKTVQMTDTVLPPSYPDDFFPGLKEAKTGVRVFYEVRTNLSRRQLQTMREAGVTCIQPGIESLSDRILEMMNKGTTTLLNIQMLKWCREFEIEAVWNLLWGFPFEPPEEYDRMAEILPLLTHLQPPSGFSQIYLARHSNHFDHAAEFGFANVRPVDSYRHIYYSLDGDSIGRLAHYFDYDYASGQR